MPECTWAVVWECAAFAEPSLLLSLGQCVVVIIFRSLVGLCVELVVTLVVGSN